VEVARLLEGDDDVALVEREDQLAREIGVTGVPAFIFGGRVAVSGAREPEMLAEAIDKALDAADGDIGDDSEDDDENA
jgi:predicted DsbA family dithiol-disulfide isomerase